MKNGEYAVYFNNEAHGDDAWIVKDSGPFSVLDAVLDGLSTEHGKIASTLTAARLNEAAIRGIGDVESALESANREVLGRGSTTVTAALKIENRLYVVNAGDSPAYLIRGGRCRELATIERGSRPYEMTNFLGCYPVFRCNINNAILQPNDRLVLVTDGIDDNIYPFEIADIVSSSSNPQGAVYDIGQLLESRRKSGTGRQDVFGRFKNDDATAIVRYFS